MAVTTTGSTINTLPKFYNKVFLERLVPNPVMMNYAIMKPQPTGNGTVVYFPRIANSSYMVSAYALTEGTAVTPRKFVDVQVSATIIQYGDAIAVSDLAELTVIDSTTMEVVKEQGDLAKNIIDKRIMEEAYGTSATASGAGFSMFFWNTASNAGLGTSTSAGFTYAGTVEYAMSVKTLRAATSALRVRNVRPFDSGYFALVCHTNTAAKILADSEWQAGYQYTDPIQMRKGAVAQFGGTEVVVDNNVTTSANGSAGNTLYYSILLGQGGLGVTQLDGGVSTIIKKSGEQDTSNPLNQFSTFGWKINFVPVRLNLSSGLIVITADGN